MTGRSFRANASENREKLRILIIGQSVRHIAASAFRAGHQVIAADCYCDIDLFYNASMAVPLRFNAFTDGSCSIDLSGEGLEELVRDVRPDAVVLGPGMEDRELPGVRVLNNPSDRMDRVSDKLWLAGWLEAQGFPAIPTVPASEYIPGDLSDSRPKIVKPRRGAGGVGCRRIEDGSHLPGAGDIVQDLLDGIPASASVVSDGLDAVTVALNEQLIGLAWLGAGGFRYCGNVTPLDPRIAFHGRADAEQIAGMAEEIVSGLELVGSNGVDFLLTKDGPIVVEVNPRFQGSLDTVDLSTGMSIFQAHIESFEGILPNRPDPECFAARGVFYASEDMTVTGRLDTENGSFTDIPLPGAVVLRGHPVVSMLASGMAREEVLGSLAELSIRIKHSVRPASQGI